MHRQKDIFWRCIFVFRTGKDVFTELTTDICIGKRGTFV